MCDAFALRLFAPPISPFALNILWQWLFDQENKQNYSHWLFLPCKAEIIFLLTCVFPWSIKLFKNKDFCLYFVVKHLWTRKLPSWENIQTLSDKARVFKYWYSQVLSVDTHTPFDSTRLTFQDRIFTEIHMTQSLMATFILKQQFHIQTS